MAVTNNLKVILEEVFPGNICKGTTVAYWLNAFFKNQMGVFLRARFWVYNQIPMCRSAVLFVREENTCMILKSPVGFYLVFSHLNAFKIWIYVMIDIKTWFIMFYVLYSYFWIIYPLYGIVEKNKCNSLLAEYSWLYGEIWKLKSV